MAQIVMPKITTPLDELSGSDLIDQAYIRLSRHTREIENDCRILCRNLTEWLAIGKDGVAHWQRLCKTWESFCLEFTNKPSEFVDAMLAGYEVLDKEAAIPLRLALETAKSRSRTELAKHGGQPGNQNATKDKNEGDNITFVSDAEPQRGTKTAYLTDRLRTQFPDIFADLEKGKYPSVHAAAIDAGIRKKMAQHLPTVEGFANAIRKHLDDDEIRELIRDLLLSVGPA